MSWKTSPQGFVNKKTFEEFVTSRSDTDLVPVIQVMAAMLKFKESTSEVFSAKS